MTSPNNISDIEAYSGVARHPFIGEAARLLCVARTGYVVSDASVDQLVERLAQLADTHGASPDVMARALYDQEDNLSLEWPEITISE